MIKLMPQKGLAPIVIVLLIALGIGGYLYYQNQNKTTPAPVQQTTQPTPIPSTSQIVFQDKLVGEKRIYRYKNQYQISYPKDWYRLDYQSWEGYTQFSNGKEIPRGPEAGSILVNVSWDIPSSWYEAALEKGGEKIKVAGYPAIKQIYETPPGTPTEYSYSVRVLVKGPKNVLLEAFSLKIEEMGNFFKPSEIFIKNDLPVFDEMISTFKFTN